MLTDLIDVIYKAMSKMMLVGIGIAVLIILLLGYLFCGR